MVEGLAEFAGELVSGLAEGLMEWLAGGYQRDVSDHGHDDAISRYADSLYELRPPPSSVPPQDLNK